MKFFSCQKMLLKIFLIAYFIGQTISTDVEEELLRKNPGWKSPSAWGLRRAESSLLLDNRIEEVNEQPCPEPSSFFNHLYYRQLVGMLFSNRKFKADSFEADTVVRTVSIKVTQGQLDKINRLLADEEGFPELREEVIKVFEHLKEGKVEIVVDEVLGFVEMVKIKGAHLFGHPDVWFALCAGLFVIVGYIAARTCGWNFFLVLFLMAFALHFFTSYLDCNRRKQIDEFIKFRDGAGANPCTQIRPAAPTFFGVIFGRSSEEQKCIDYMHSTAKVNIGMCQPMEVLGSYFTRTAVDANVHIISSLVDQFAVLTADRGYFQAILITALFAYITYGLLKVTVGTAISSFFAYGMPGTTRHRHQPTLNESSQHSGVEQITQVLRETVQQNHQLITRILDAEATKSDLGLSSMRGKEREAERNETKEQESLAAVVVPKVVDELGGGDTRRSSETDSIEVIPESLDPDSDFEVIKE